MREHFFADKFETQSEYLEKIQSTDVKLAGSQKQFNELNEYLNQHAAHAQLAENLPLWQRYFEQCTRLIFVLKDNCHLNL